MSRHALVIGAALAVLGACALHATAGGLAEDGLPGDLSADATALRGELLALANETTPERWATANGSYAALSPFLGDLAPRPAAQLASFMDALGPAVLSGNGTDARSLALAAARAVERDLEPAAETWQRHRTGVVADTPRAVGDRIEVPLVLMNAPPGGFAAFEVALHYDPANLTAVAARLTTGQGDAVVDAPNGTVRFASFDGRGLAGLGSAGTPVELGRAVFERPAVAGHPLRVEVVDLVDRQGAPIPAVGAPATLDPGAAVQGGAAGGASRLVAVGAVVVLGVGAAVAARKFLKV